MTTNGKRKQNLVHICDTCRGTFFASRIDAKYCTSACRSKAARRRHQLVGLAAFSQSEMDALNSIGLTNKSLEIVSRIVSPAVPPSDLLDLMYDCLVCGVFSERHAAPKNAMSGIVPESVTMVSGSLTKGGSSE